MGLHGERTQLLMCQVRTMELYCICRARYKSQIPWFLEENLCGLIPELPPPPPPLLFQAQRGSDTPLSSSRALAQQLPAKAQSLPTVPNMGLSLCTWLRRRWESGVGRIALFFQLFTPFTFESSYLTQLVSSAHVSQATYLFIHYLGFTHLMRFIHSVCFSQLRSRIEYA